MILDRQQTSQWSTYLGEGTVVPEVTLVGEAVTDVTQLALLDILLDGVEELLLGDLLYTGNQYRVDWMRNEEEVV